MKNFSVVIILSVWLFSCAEEEQSGERKVYNGPLLINENVDVVYTDSARVKFKMQAAEQIKLQNEDEDFPKGMFLEFFDREEKKESTLIANYAYFNKQENRWFVKGDVVLNNFARNRILKSEELYWSSEKGEVWCDTSVRVIVQTPDQTLYGKGLKAKDDFSDYEIYKPTGSFEL